MAPVKARASKKGARGGNLVSPARKKGALEWRR